MKKINLIIIGLITLCSTACMSLTHSIAPYFSPQNGSSSYFVKPVTINNSQQFSEIFNKQWYFSADIKHKELGKKSVDTCKSLIESIDNNFSAERDFEYGYIQAMNINCQLWQELSLLKRSKVSYLPETIITKDFSNKAPPELALIISNDDERRLVKTKSWQEMSKIKKVETLNQDQAIYYDNTGGIQKLTLMAKGDFNQDGIEDVVLYMENTVEGGSYNSTYGYILTRLSSNAPYTLLKQL